MILGKIRKTWYDQKTQTFSLETPKQPETFDLLVNPNPFEISYRSEKLNWNQKTVVVLKLMFSVWSELYGQRVDLKVQSLQAS